MKKEQRKIFLRQKWVHFLIAVILGSISGFVLKIYFNWEISLLMSWNAGAITVMTLMWFNFQPLTGEHTKKIVLTESIRYSFLDIFIILASCVSLVVVVFLVTIGKGDPVELGVGLISVPISWSLVHAVYTFHYAELYYKKSYDKIEGGVDFNNDSLPSFWDFAYLSYTIGMTYQVSDTNFSTTSFRKAALGHALISFLFNTVIISVLVNFIADLA
ncbi:hypothetical protein FC19_GL001650 [Liquorilactobacillus aquaticus DSM 21051]|uniref:DUF1345 domain-containing protein n=1 Tax=Liquorilactobacillus aquaticus DSM 21051 TaxID=1423725 RepID=A0A0R2D6L4_9LACO|nr:DUF1345 domain-containing protein [Liquorilactobacillus aquaticus]KRM97604.1 hypothetical protein FC19_GL001650 [Liquorilactobacillus aquaticus DSM 21051]